MKDVVPGLRDSRELVSQFRRKTPQSGEGCETLRQGYPRDRVGDRFALGVSLAPPRLQAGSPSNRVQLFPYAQKAVRNHPVDGIEEFLS